MPSSDDGLSPRERDEKLACVDQPSCFVTTDVPYSQSRTSFGRPNRSEYSINPLTDGDVTSGDESDDGDMTSESSDSSSDREDWSDAPGVYSFCVLCFYADILYSYIGT